MTELGDVLASEAKGDFPVWVQIPPSAQWKTQDHKPHKVYGPELYVV